MHDNQMGGVRSVTQKALHGMSGQHTVSVQEAVHMVDGQELVIFSDYVTHVSLQQAATMKSKDDEESKDIVSRYRNRPKNMKICLWKHTFTRFFVERHYVIKVIILTGQSIECLFQRE